MTIILKEMICGNLSDKFKTEMIKVFVCFIPSVSSLIDMDPGNSVVYTRPNSTQFFLNSSACSLLACSLESILGIIKDCIDISLLLDGFNLLPIPSLFLVKGKVTLN